MTTIPHFATSRDSHNSATMAPTTAPQRREFVHPDASHAKKKYAPPLPRLESVANHTIVPQHRVPSAYGIPPISAFYWFLAAGLVSAWFAPIQDCDETFNYWEPTHYLSHGYGLQTWEYSPDFAIRSWLYIGLHAIVGNVRRLLPQSTKVCEIWHLV